MKLLLMGLTLFIGVSSYASECKVLVPKNVTITWEDKVSMRDSGIEFIDVDILKSTDVGKIAIIESRIGNRVDILGHNFARYKYRFAKFFDSTDFQGNKILVYTSTEKPASWVKSCYKIEHKLNKQIARLERREIISFSSNNTGLVLVEE